MKRRLLILLLLLVPLPFVAMQQLESLLSSPPMAGKKTAPVAIRQPAPNGDEPMLLAWEEMIPSDFEPEKLLAGKDLSELDDEDPRAKKIMAAYQAEINRAPTVQALHGRQVKIAGYVVPLEMDGQVAAEFLLVPYFGACIHVPPPPANQIIHVRGVGEGTTAARSWYDTVWVIGRMTLERLEDDLGTAAYTIRADRIEPYLELGDEAPADPG